MNQTELLADRQVLLNGGVTTRLLGETAASHADVVDVSKLNVNSDEFLLIATLQGLANRAAPKVFLFTGDQD